MGKVWPAGLALCALVAGGGCAAVLPAIEGVEQVIEHEQEGDAMGVVHELASEVRGEVSRILGDEWQKHQPAVDVALDKAVEAALAKLAGGAPAAK